MPYFLLACPHINSEDNTWKEIQAKGGIGSNGTNGLAKAIRVSTNLIYNNTHPIVGQARL